MQVAYSRLIWHAQHTHKLLVVLLQLIEADSGQRSLPREPLANPPPHLQGWSEVLGRWGRCARFGKFTRLPVGVQSKWW
jgi:hypothetical protein